MANTKSINATTKIIPVYIEFFFMPLNSLSMRSSIEIYFHNQALLVDKAVKNKMTYVIHVSNIQVDKVIMTPCF